MNAAKKIKNYNAEGKIQIKCKRSYIIADSGNADTPYERFSQKNLVKMKLSA